MSRVRDSFARLRSQQRSGLAPFIVAGHPCLEQLQPIVAALSAAQPALIEIGLPYSDPIADGPVISGAMHHALSRGATIAAILEKVVRIRPTTNVPLVAMVSHAIVHRLGGAAFIDNAVECGFDGFIIPDADSSSLDEITATCARLDVSLSMLVAPKTSPKRLEQQVRRSTGFVYLLARAGLTGTNGSLTDVSRRVAAIRAIADIPVAVGFGISSASHVREATQEADAAIVGSAFVRAIDANSDDPAAAVLRLAQELSAGLRSPR